jgi:hypothetical protein
LPNKQKERFVGISSCNHSELPQLWLKAIPSAAIYSGSIFSAHSYGYADDSHSAANSGTSVMSVWGKEILWGCNHLHWSGTYPSPNSSGPKLSSHLQWFIPTSYPTSIYTSFLNGWFKMAVTSAFFHFQTSFPLQDALSTFDSNPITRLAI